MKTVLTLSCLLGLMFCTASCKKGVKNAAPVTGDYLIIGNPGGFTNLTRLTFYLISNGQLKEDTTVPYSAVPADVSKFNFNIVLAPVKYDVVKSLPSSIPVELLTKNNEHVGSLFPDAGYTDVRTSLNGVAYRWYFEADQDASSAAVQQFVKNVRAVFN